MAVNSHGAPGKAPPCKRKTPLAAVIVPSFFMPILISIDVDAVGPVARNTSERLITILTGLLALRDKASATGSIKTVVFPPKPPPISEAVTRNWLVSNPKSAAHIFWAYQWPCVVHHNSPFPSFPRLPRQAWGSIYP